MQFARTPEKFAGTQVRALLKIVHVFKKRLLRRDLLQDDVLKNLAVIKFANATNFVVTAEEAARIEKLLEDAGEEPVNGTVDVRDEVDRWAELQARTFMPKQQLEEIERLLTEKKQVIFEGPPGSGKTYVANLFARHFAGLGLAGDPDPQVKVVQFHQSYAYEDFVEGIRPESNSAGQIEYNVKPGVFKRLCSDAVKEAANGKRFVIIIDEINRGNISRIFGELLLLLEYRNLEVELPTYKSGDQLFAIPKNVYVIGTMNTTDRSLAQIDYALRRRFFFYRLMPTEGGTAPVLRRWLDAQANFAPSEREQILKLFLSLNDRIRKELGEHFQVGHSYFMSRDIRTDAGRERIWKFAVMPLLEEYFYNRRDRDALLSEFSIQSLMKGNERAEAAGA